jgi:hypothetical protein
MDASLPSIHPFPGGRIVRRGADLEVQISGNEIAKALGIVVAVQPCTVAKLSTTTDGADHDPHASFTDLHREV